MSLYLGSKKSKIYLNNTGNASGTNIVMSNGAKSKLLKTSIYGKTTNQKSYQLFDANLFSTHSKGGVTVTNNGDGSLTIDGEGTITSDFWVVFFYSHDEVVKMFKAGDIHAYFDTLTYPALTMYLEDKANGTSIKIGENSWENSNDAIITEEMLSSPTSQLVVGMYGVSGAIIKPGTVKPMIYQDGNGTWEPFAKASDTPILESIKNNEGNIEVTVKSSQLFDASKISSFSQGGATITNNNDGSFTIAGSGNLTTDVGKDFRFSHEETIKLLKAGNIYSNYNTTSNPYITFYLVNGGWNVLFTLDNCSSTQTTQFLTKDMINNPSLELLIAIYGEAGTAIKPGIIKPMIYQDGNGAQQQFSSQSHTVFVGNGLKGIPLGSAIPEIIANSPSHMSGVYFGNGQYWIGDTVDYETGYLTRRITEKTYDGNVEINQHPSNSSLYYFNIGNDIDTILDTNIPIQSDYYKFTSNDLDSMINEECKFDISSNNKIVYLCKTDCLTVDEMKTLLTNNPITIQYILNQPIETAISASELASYNSLYSYNGITLINNDCNAFMRTKYFKK